MPEVKSQIFNPETLQDMLPIYYKRLFPHKQFYRWLSYNLCKFQSKYFPAKSHLFVLILSLQPKMEFSQTVSFPSRSKMMSTFGICRLKASQSWRRKFAVEIHSKSISDPFSTFDRRTIDQIQTSKQCNENWCSILI